MHLSRSSHLFDSFLLTSFQCFQLSCITLGIYYEPVKLQLLRQLSRFSYHGTLLVGISPYVRMFLSFDKISLLDPYIRRFVSHFQTFLPQLSFSAARPIVSLMLKHLGRFQTTSPSFIPKPIYFIDQSMQEYQRRCFSST